MNNVSDILYSKSFIAWFHLQSQWEAVKIPFLLDCPRSQRLSEHRVRGAVDYANTNCWRWKDFACFVRCFKCCPQKCGRKLSGIFPLISTSLNSKLFFTLHFFFFYLTYFLLHIIIDSHVYYSPLGKHSFCQTYFSFSPYFRGGDIVHSKWEVVRHSSSQSKSLEQLNIFLHARQRLYTIQYTVAIYSCAKVHTLQLPKPRYSCACTFYTAVANHAIQLRQRTLYSWHKPCYSCARPHCTAAANHATAAPAHTIQLPQTN